MKKIAFLILGLLLFAMLTISAYHDVLVQAPAQAEKESVQVPVIMYHSIYHTSSDQWTLSPEAFEADLKYLSENGYQTVLIADLVNYVDSGTALPEKPIVLTFDDGYYNNYSTVLPLLEQYDMKIVLSVIGSHAELWSSSEDISDECGHLTWSQLAEMQESGRVEMANHTWDLHKHENGRNGCCIKEGEDPAAYREMLIGDVAKLQETLVEWCGEEPLCFTYPFGSTCDAALEVVQEMGFRATLSCYEGINQISKGDSGSLFNMRRNNRTPQQSVQSILEKFA